jgi:natural resistance-associated macrophage protein
MGREREAQQEARSLENDESFSIQSHHSNEALSFTGHHREGDAEVEVCDEDDGADESPDAQLKFTFSWKKLWRFMGPGWLMSLAYLDPGNLESDLQQGAFTGYSLVWVLWWSTVIGLILQEMAARIGVVSGRDLAQNVKRVYPKWLNIVIYVNMEIAVIASDIQEVVGSGIAIHLLTNGFVPVWIGCIITGLDTFTFLAVHYLGVRYLEALITSLVMIMVVCFFFEWGKTTTDVGDMFKGWIVPILHSYGITQAVGTVGAVIMPHNLYLHSGLVISRKINRNSPNRMYEAINYNAMESALALLVSFFINLAVVAVNANSFYDPACAVQDGGPWACLSDDAFDPDTNSGSGTICTLPSGGGQTGKCGDIGLQLEGTALKHGLGNTALYIWGIGLFAAGQAATMTCTYAGQIIMGGCLEIELVPWKRVALTRCIALGPSVFIAWWSQTVDSQLYNTINELLNTLQSVQLPFAMLPLLHISSQTHILCMFKSGRIKSIVNLCLAAIILVINAVLIVQYASGFDTVGIVLVCCYAALYLWICARMILNTPRDLPENARSRLV